MKPIFISLLALCLPLMAADKDREDFESAKALALKGDRVWQFNLGVMYANGEGVEKDLKEAVKWYRKAAEQGYADAQNSLGAKYGNGEGVEQDFKQAFKWLRKAAEQGNAKAQYNLGVLYERGLGVEKGLKEAAKWYQKADEQGYAQAKEKVQELAGYLPVKVDEAPVSTPKFIKAVFGLHGIGVDGMGVMIENTKLNGYRLGEAEAKAIEFRVETWLTKAGIKINRNKVKLLDSSILVDPVPYIYVGVLPHRLKNGGVSGYTVSIDVKRMVNYEANGKKYSTYAVMRSYGGTTLPNTLMENIDKYMPIFLRDYKSQNPGVVVSPVKAMPADFQELMALARQGNAEAQNIIGVRFDKGTDVKQDKNEAVKWWSKAAEQGHPGAQANLGGMYLAGVGVEQDKAKGLELIKTAAEQGEVRMQVMLGKFYYSGNFVEKNLNESAKWFRKAALQGNAEAQLMMSTMNGQAMGIPQDMVASYAWALIGARNGSKGCQTVLELLPTLLGANQIAAGKALVEDLIKKNPKLLNKK